MRRVLVGAATLLIAVLALAAPAGAHASLQEAAPVADAIVDSAPSDVVLRFSEPVDVSLGRLRVTGPDGDRLDAGPPAAADGGRVIRTAVDEGGKGSYYVEWSVVSLDGHVLEGSFVFSVGETSAVREPAEAGRAGLRSMAGSARFAVFAGLLLLVGALAMGFLRLVPLRMQLIAIGGAAIAVGSAVVFVTSTALASGRSIGGAWSLLDESLGTRTGSLTAGRGSAGATCVVLALLGARFARRSVTAVVAALAALVAVLLSVSGHPWTTDARWAAVVLDATHVLATGVWIGGLAVVLLGGVGRRDRLSSFSPVALGAAGVTVVTGSLSGWLQTESFGGLAETAYGRRLLVKIAAVAVVLGLAYLNRIRLRDAELSAWVVRGELGAAAVVLALTASLVNLPPARETYVQPIRTSTVISGDGGGDVLVEIDPARAGSNTLHAYFYDRSGLPKAVDLAEIRVARPGGPARLVEVTPVTPEHVSAYGLTFPTSGRWRITIDMLADGRVSSATTEVTIR